MNINTVVITGNLTKDPELKTTGGGTELCQMRVANNGRRKDGDNWVDDPNFFNVTVFGKQGANCAQYLAKGRPVAIHGRLNWREWEQDGNHREAINIIASDVQFLGSGKGDGAVHAGGSSDVPADTSDMDTGSGTGSMGTDDDIPF